MSKRPRRTRGRFLVELEETLRRKAEKPLVPGRGQLISSVTDFLYIVCAICGQSTGSEPSNSAENRIGTLGPRKGFGTWNLGTDGTFSHI